MPAGRSKDTHFTVDSLTKGNHYRFRVKAVNIEGCLLLIQIICHLYLFEGASDPLETETDILAKNPFDRPDKPGKPTPTDWDRDFVALEWTPPLSDNGSPIEKYQIEKRSKYGRFVELRTLLFQ